MHIVWFKRDLRIEDNHALAQATQYGTIMPLYIIEPELWQQPSLSYRQYVFLQECLEDLNNALLKLGQELIIKVGNVVSILNDYHQQYHIDGLWSHQETWNNWTYERDKHVRIWTKKNNIMWHESSQNGVIRGLKNRDGWASHWYYLMKKPVISPPKKLQKIDIISDKIPSPRDLRLQDDGCYLRQKGGRLNGLDILHDFLYHRGEHYTKEMSSPVTAYDSCSRLSPYIAFGTLSIREIFHLAEQRRQEIKDQPYGKKGKWGSALRSFSGRLRWHCHFIQKLEDEPQIEFANMHSIYNALRVDDFNDAHFQAWILGKTGYPMIDACMRALIATGWLNFRMRAMLISFASYHLWLHWKQPALHLSRLFIDYEPGIHYSQIQMQSGTTGINSVRIYNPIKQGIDHDPNGIFIRQWIPELSNMIQDHIHMPWKSPSLMGDYPMPIIDEKTARKAAADKIFLLRRHKDHKEEANHIVNKHGSRKSGLSRTVHRRTTKKTNIKQTELPL